MKLIDRISIDLSGLKPEKLEKLKKAFAPRVKLTPDQTWKDVTVDMMKEKFVESIKVWVADVDKEESRISYTDMDE